MENNKNQNRAIDILILKLQITNLSVEGINAEKPVINSCDCPQRRQWSLGLGVSSWQCSFMSFCHWKWLVPGSGEKSHEVGVAGVGRRLWKCREGHCHPVSCTVLRRRRNLGSETSPGYFYSSQFLSAQTQWRCSSYNQIWEEKKQFLFAINISLMHSVSLHSEKLAR